MKKWENPKLKDFNLAITESVFIPEPQKCPLHAESSVLSLSRDVPEPDKLYCCACPCCHTPYHAATYDEAYNAYAAHYRASHENGCSS